MPTPRKVRIITGSVSDGARALKETLEARGKEVSLVRVTAAPKAHQRLNIKWGCFQMGPLDFGGPVVNSRASDVSLNKMLCFRALQTAGVPIPDCTDSLEVAQRWLDEGGRRIYQRNLLRGSEGDGIVVVEKDREGNYVGENRLTRAPLYTKGLFGERREYRIHVFKKDGLQRFYIQQKRQRTTDMTQEELGARSGTVRNLAGGWIFAHNDIVVPRQQTIDIAVHAVTALGLDFGAVDLIEMGDVTKGSAVLEINCAPGLQGATLDFYATAVIDLLNGVVDQAAERLDELVDPEDEHFVIFDEEGQF